MAIMPKQKTTHSNAGLRALEKALAKVPTSQRAALADLPLFEAPDLLAATDGIAIAFVALAPMDKVAVEEAAVKRRIKLFLGRGWKLRDDSIETFHGVTALPPPSNTPSVGEAWALARELVAIEGVESATPLFAQIALIENRRDGVLGIAAGDEGPTDPKQRREWHLDVMNVPKAWDHSRKQGREPGEGVIVAVLDTGYTDHQEVFGQLRKKNGQPDQVYGIDLLDGDDPRDPLEGYWPLTNAGHGTSVASVIASPEGRPQGQPQNDDWMTGIAPSAQVMPVRVTTNVVLLLPNKITPAVKLAVDAGADVINVSLGLPYYWPAFHAAIRYAVNRGVIVVAAAGNYWPAVVYPARFPEVLAAANCNWKEQQWQSSTAGDAVDVLAPGVAVQCAISHRAKGRQISYTVKPGTGTTFATACCSGLAALWLACHGGRQKLIDHYNGDARRVPQAFHYLIRATAKKLPDVPTGLYGEGLPQADALLKAGLPKPATLDHDSQGLRLQLTPLTEARGAALHGIVLSGEMAQDNGVALMCELLGEPILEALPEQLLSEISLHLASRPELHRKLLNGLVDATRDALLASQHLSNALRRQLKTTADARARGNRAATTTPVFQPRKVPKPTRRSLQVYAFDPGLADSLRAMDYNVVTIDLPWERLEPGPIGEYLEVVDVDPASNRAYEPVNLEDPYLLSSDGLTPDEGDPWFHQQTVYAVAMKTIRHFEVALGRPAMWAVGRKKQGREREPFCQRLRIYPHALRERNAYYSPSKRALMFGYFRSPGAGDTPTGPMVFTCLSYDIIAHETTHALLDGMYSRYIEDTNPDVLAFHEAFADLVALFQHFTHPEVLRATIAETRGDLETDSLLGKLAQQFGQATGKRGALRDAIGHVQEGTWRRNTPNATLLQHPEYLASAHQRGSILVAAVFDAFLKIYQRRTRAVIRLATNGSGVLPAGSISADLVEALAQEAAKTAGQVLRLCIRALDYLPPIDITFGDYLRAVITADSDLVPDDPLGYRIALVEAFRAWGIQPKGVTTIAPESLKWNRPDGFAEQFTLSTELLDQLNRLLPAWLVNRSRKELHNGTVAAKIRFNQELKKFAEQALGPEIGIDLQERFEVHTLRPTATLSPDGVIHPMVVVTLLQKKESEQITIRTGSTLLINRGDGKIRYVIHKGNSREALEKHHQFRREIAAANHPYSIIHGDEPFAGLHLTGHL